MRADARKHRQNLIEAASRVFAARGHMAPLQDVLTESGLGRGTLYRHFPDRASLIMAVVDFEMQRAQQEVEERSGDPTLFLDFLERQSRLASVHIPAICELDEERLAPFVEDIGPKYESCLSGVLKTARETNQVRPDLSVDDLRLIIEILSNARSAKCMLEEDSFARAMCIILRGINPSPASAGDLETMS